MKKIMLLIAIMATGFNVHANDKAELLQAIKQNNFQKITELGQRARQFDMNLTYEDLNLAKKPDNNTALMIAAQYSNDPKVALHLIEYGADVNAQNEHGDTALMFAAENNNVNMLELLIKKGAHISAKNKDGYNALMFAADHPSSDKSVKMVYLLASNGAIVDDKNNYGDTPLMFAASQGNLSVISRLIDYLANINTKNNDGNTAIVFAIDSNSFSSVRYLIDRGADIARNFHPHSKEMKQLLNEYKNPQPSWTQWFLSKLGYNKK